MCIIQAFKRFITLAFVGNRGKWEEDCRSVEECTSSNETYWHSNNTIRFRFKVKAIISGYETKTDERCL